MAIVGIAVMRFGMQHELAAFRLRHRCYQRCFAAELIRRSRFAFTDALDLGRMEGIHFWSALFVILMLNLDRQRHKVMEPVLELGTLIQLTANVADHPAKPTRRNFIARRARLNCLAWIYRPAMMAARFATRR